MTTDFLTLLLIFFSNS